MLGWMKGSLIGHIAAGCLLYSLPVYLILLGLHINDGGAVTTIQFFKGLLMVPIGGSVFGALFWFTATARGLKKTKGDD